MSAWDSPGASRKPHTAHGTRSIELVQQMQRYCSQAATRERAQIGARALELWLCAATQPTQLSWVSSRSAWGSSGASRKPHTAHGTRFIELVQQMQRYCSEAATPERAQIGARTLELQPCTAEAQGQVSRPCPGSAWDSPGASRQAHGVQGTRFISLDR